MFCCCKTQNLTCIETDSSPQWQTTPDPAVGPDNLSPVLPSQGGGQVVQERIHTGGPWSPEERLQHIHVLELRAAFLVLKTFLPDQRPLAVLLPMDNVTAIAFLNHMGGPTQYSFWNWQYKYGSGAFRGRLLSMQSTCQEY